MMKMAFGNCKKSIKAKPELERLDTLLVDFWSLLYQKMITINPTSGMLKTVKENVGNMLLNKHNAPPNQRGFFAFCYLKTLLTRGGQCYKVRESKGIQQFYLKFTTL